MTPVEFESMLDELVQHLTESLSESIAYHQPDAFENLVREVLKVITGRADLRVARDTHPHAFPDIAVNGFGIEVKFTNKDSWLAVGNSVFEGMRIPNVEDIYVVYGKAGGEPEVRWARYEDCITHVRISHAPRFVIEMDREASLFEQLDIEYSDFRELDPVKKMTHIREYSRNRLKPGERLWWLEEQDATEHGIPAQVRLYMELEDDEKRQMRAEAAILCPVVVAPPRTKFKYVDAAMYLLRQHGVFCPQARDLFSAGSVGLRGDSRRGGNYVQRALKDLEPELRVAAHDLDQALIREYWGIDVAPQHRLAEWLRLADSHARDWVPSQHLFNGEFHLPDAPGA